MKQAAADAQKTCGRLKATQPDAGQAIMPDNEAGRVSAYP